MKAAIMQPYFMPYIGYWQLIASVDVFVVYDNIEYTKKGWFNRNRILEAGHDRLFTIPIKKDSDYLPVKERYLSDDSDKENTRTLRIIENNYRKAPYFNEAFPVIKQCLTSLEKNLFEFIYNSIKTVANYLDIGTEIIISSSVDIDHTLKAEKKVLAICRAVHATTYINSIGGLELYDRDTFVSQGIELKFIKAKLTEYPQFGQAFVPGLSIIDVLMFNSKDEAKELLKRYDLV